MNISLGFEIKKKNVLSSPLFIFKRKAFVDEYSSVWSGGCYGVNTLTRSRI